MNKYVFTGETKKYEGKILKRIRAVFDFDDVKAGELGGYIEHEHNLPNTISDSSWVYNNPENE